MTKSENGKNEARRLKQEVIDLNNKLKNEDVELREDYKKNLNIDTNTIKCFVVAGGRDKHYDIIIHFKDGSRKGIEHKGITGLKKLADEERPWNLTPQLVNPPYNFCELSLMYCKLWWKCLFIIKQLFPGPILPEVPTYEEWLKDAKQGSTKTEWGKALKKIRNYNNTNKYLINEVVDQSLIQFWTIIQRDRQDLLEKAEKTIQDMMNKCLDDKDIWLNAFYEKDSDIQSKKQQWSKTPKISNLKCEVCIEENRKPYLKLIYNLSSNKTKKFVGKALLRWGNTKGIANIRWNLS